eukprot:jgi/Tetstr1/453723/TSEL_040679.t1
MPQPPRVGATLRWPPRVGAALRRPPRPAAPAAAPRCAGRRALAPRCPGRGALAPRCPGRGAMAPRCPGRASKGTDAVGAPPGAQLEPQGDHRGGHLEVLQYLAAHGCPCHAAVLSAASHNGRLAVLRRATAADCCP